MKLKKITARDVAVALIKYLHDFDYKNSYSLLECLKSLKNLTQI